MLLVLCPVCGLAAEPAILEVEPNDTPAEATPVTAPAILMGSMESGDQDAYRWTVSDVDAQKRWTFELHGIPGRRTIVEILHVEFAENGVDVTGYETLMTMGTRDGLTPSIHADLIFEPGAYILGVAHAGGGDGGFRPPAASLSFGEENDEASTADEPGGYRLRIAEGRSVNLTTDFTAGDTQADARALRLDSETAGFVAAETAWYALEFNEAQAAQRWDVQLQVPVGRELKATLRDAAGVELTQGSTDARGRLAFRDLAPPAGTWFLEHGGPADAGFIRLFGIESAGVRIEGEEAEPNDDWPLANRVDLTRPVSGRMQRDSESDHFRFSLDEDTVDGRLALRLETDPENSLQLCLLDGDRGQSLQCRTRTGGVELEGLVLTPGDWGFLVAHGPEGAEYTVTLASDGAIEPDLEAEPNDSYETATGVPSNNRIRGRFDGQGDTDYYRFVVTEEPQLWRFQVLGDTVHEVMYHDNSGRPSQSVRPLSNQRRVQLDNLYLLPGVHYFSVAGRGAGDYTVLARPLGPPDPNGEREPNDDVSRMTPLRMGQTRTGLLADADDVDLYRFTLDHWDHIRLTITPPADGALSPEVYWYGASITLHTNAGKPVDLSGLFPPGDYHVMLLPKTASEAEYRIALERLPRFACLADCEPNNLPGFANLLPPTLVIEGRAGGWREGDMYALPVFDKDAEISLTVSDNRSLDVWEAEISGSTLITQEAPGVYRGTLPAGLQTYLTVGTSEAPDYRVEIEFPGGGPEPATVAAAPQLALTLKLDTTEVAAYRHYGQRVRGNLEIANNGAEAASVELDAATSNHRWHLTFEQAQVAIPAGGTLGVPVLLSVPDDAWADQPVRVSVRARNAAGAQVETSADVTAGRESPPVGPVRHWPLPEALLGGFNVALGPLGGSQVEDYVDGGNEGAGFPFLFDGMAADNQYMGLRGGAHNLPITVEFAGGSPVAVAGVAVNLFGRSDPLNWMSDLDVSLSMDGETFTPVLFERLLPIRSEQAFVLEAPVEARFARLILRDTFEGRNQQLTLGEFKVIARPGTDPSQGAGFNLAARALGGHVVWYSPDGPHRFNEMLVEDGQFASVRPPTGERFEWVVGFHHNRAAQLSRIEWVEAPDQADQRIGTVTLSASLDSPIGPWISLGE